MYEFSCHLFFRLRSVRYVSVCIWTSAHSVCMHLHIHSFFFSCAVFVCVSSLHRRLFRKQTEESLDWQCTFGVRVHILWTIAQQKRDDCMIRPRQAILCLFEEEGAPSSPEQVFLRLSSPSAPCAPIATVSWWKFPKKSVRYRIKFHSYSWLFFSIIFIFYLPSHNQTATQGLLLASPNPQPQLHVRIPLFSD